MTEEGKVTFHSVPDVLGHFGKSGAAAEEAIRIYRHQLKEFTGHDPDKAVTAIDVVRIVEKVFFPRPPAEEKVDQD